MKKSLIKRNIFKRGKDNPCCVGNSGQAVYGLGVIGAAVYYISAATGFWMGVLGILKSLVWPAFLVYELLRVLTI